MTWTATLPMSKPAARTRAAVSASSAMPAAPAHAGSDVPNWLPRSPSPAAESRASQAACAATSPSEWPSRPVVLVGPGQTGQVHRDAGRRGGGRRRRCPTRRARPSPGRKASSFTGRSCLSDNRRVRTSRHAWWLAGVVAGAAGLATSYFAAMVMTIRESPVVAVAELVIQLTPGPVVERAIQLLGHHDKPFLVTCPADRAGAAVRLGRPAGRTSWWKPLLAVRR